MKTAAVRSTDITAMPGHPLNAEFWADHQDGENYAAWKSRKDLETRLKALLVSLQRIQEKTELLLRTVRKTP